jgi:hypothetical protein
LYPNHLITKLLQVGDFAAAIGVTRRAVQKWLKLGRLPGCTKQRNGYALIPSHYIEEYQRGEIPLAPANVRRKEIAPYPTESRRSAAA